MEKLSTAEDTEDTEGQSYSKSENQPYSHIRFNLRVLCVLCGAEF